ncbi:glycosyltransferase family 2 protein [Gottschalkiaceae bacterium SANA]|nr:glycosyltransferase family 2 protein [Gottschalkiaceae bacterium SANA]
MDMKVNAREKMFSVIVTAYNCEKYILETLESIDAQSFNDYQVIIIEDCSLDSTPDLIKEYIAGKEAWKMYKNERNRGVGYSRNRAFSLASGRFVAILDSDDVWLENKLDQQYQVLKDGDIDLCYSSYAYIDADSNDLHFTYRTKSQVTYQSLLKENYIGCSTAVISNQIAKTNKMKENMLNEDFFFWLQVLKQGYVGKGILQPLVKYRIHDKGRSYNKFKAAYNRYFIYRQNEELSLACRIFYFINYAFRATRKFSRVYLHALLNRNNNKH